MTVDEFRGKLLPAIADGLNLMIKADQAAATAILQAFDSDSNGTITSQELENNPLLMIAISPDLDLLDASGNFNPSQDGVKNSYSVGLGFTCVPATLTGTGVWFPRISSNLASTHLPQVAENNTPRPMDAAGECSLYDEL